MAAPVANGELLDWCLAAITIALWSAIYVIFVWRDPELRRSLRRAFATRRLSIRRRSRTPKRGPNGAGFDWPRPVHRPPPRPATSHAARITSSALRKPEEDAAPAAGPVLAVWGADHLPLRYRLLGQVRRAANDN